MGQPKKPRKKYRPKGVLLNPVAHAIRGASLLESGEVQYAMRPMLTAFDALRQGKAKVIHIAAINTALRMLVAAHKRNLITETDEYLQGAVDALGTICEKAYDGDSKANQWSSPMPDADELEAIAILRDIFRHMLEHLSSRELTLLHDDAVNWSRAHQSVILPNPFTGEQP